MGIGQWAMELVSKQSLVVCGTEWILIVVIVQKTETANFAVMVMVGRSATVFQITPCFEE